MLCIQVLPAPLPTQIILKVSQNQTQMTEVPVTTEKFINKQNTQRKLLKYVLEVFQSVRFCKFIDK
jgi:hypothetical protein